MDFLKGPHTVWGSFTGQSIEVEAAVRFSVLTDVGPMIEVSRWNKLVNHMRK
ncbi:hypothetical protein [Paenibacillus peoriae]|uniref:hypothetical protein n=1 Tax=Paenibacillus peoriae TaxID=59893 RepID=UPI003F96C9EB